MGELIAYQCPSCAGHVDPITMQCKSCGLQFKMKSDGTLMRIDMYAHKCIPIGASVYGRIRVEEPQFNNRKFDETNQLIDKFFGGLR